MDGAMTEAVGGLALEPGEGVDDSTVVVVSGCDDGYAMGLTVALHSTLRHLAPGRAAHVFVLDGGLSEQSVARLRASLEAVRPGVALTVIADDPTRFAEYNVHWYARAAYLRLLIPEVVPAKYRRVLYIDADLVVTGDVAELWELPDDGHAFRAAHDDGVRGTDYVRETLGFAGLPDGTPYFNSGVMLIDLPRWKRERISERAEAVLAEHSDACINIDQDALNVVAAGVWGELPAGWNHQVVGETVWSEIPADGRIGLTHYINDKPWRPETRCVRQAEFDEALRASGWLAPADWRRYRLATRQAEARHWLKTSSSLRLVRGARRRLMRVVRG